MVTIPRFIVARPVIPGPVIPDVGEIVSRLIVARTIITRPVGSQIGNARSIAARLIASRTVSRNLARKRRRSLSVSRFCRWPVGSGGLQTTAGTSGRFGTRPSGGPGTRPGGRRTVDTGAAS